MDRDPECCRGRGSLFYGWIMLPVTTIGLFCSAPGQSFGVQPFKELFSSSLALSRSEVSGAYMVGTLIAALPMTYIGWCMDRFGARRTMMVVITLLALACIWLSQATGLVTLLIGFMLVRMFGQGSLTLLNFNTIAMWFHRRLGLVNALMSMGLAGGIALVPTLNLMLIDRLGWRGAYAAMGVGFWLLMFPLLLLVFRNKPEDLGERPDGEALPEHEQGVGENESPSFSLKGAMSTRAYWITLAAVGFWSMANTGLIICMATVFETRGLSLDAAAGNAATVMLAFGIMLAAMQLPAGYLVDRAPANVVLSLSALCMAGVFALFYASDGGPLIYAIGVLQGLSQALLMAVNATIWVRYFGRVNLGKIKGTTTTTMVASSATGPMLVDGSYDLIGSYHPIVALFIAMPLVLAVAALFATRPKVASAAEAAKPNAAMETAG